MENYLYIPNGRSHLTLSRRCVIFISMAQDMDINRTGLRTCHVTPYRQGDRPPFVLGAEPVRDVM